MVGEPRQVVEEAMESSDTCSEEVVVEVEEVKTPLIKEERREESSSSKSSKSVSGISKKSR